MRRKQVIQQTRLTTVQVEAIKKLAEVEDVSISQWIRDAVRQRLEREAPKPDQLRNITQTYAS